MEPLDDTLLAEAHLVLLWLETVLKHFTTREMLLGLPEVGTTTVKPSIVKLLQIVRPHLGGTKANVVISQITHFFLPLGFYTLPFFLCFFFDRDCPFTMTILAVRISISCIIGELLNEQRSFVLHSRVMLCHVELVALVKYLSRNRSISSSYNLMSTKFNTRSKWLPTIPIDFEYIW